MKTFNLPDLGEGLQEAEIVTWHVGVGDRIVADQPLVSVETDKAIVEIPSPYSGSIVELCAEVGTTIEVGNPVATIDDGEAADSTTVAGSLPDDQPPLANQSDTAPRSTDKVKATPAVRALAGKLEVDLATVTASGTGGAITADDIRRAADESTETEPAETLTGTRRAMARRMAQAHSEVVPATISDDADVSAWSGGGDVTVRLIQAVAAACQAEPALNAWYDPATNSRRLRKQVDVGLAVDTPDGLFVPVLRDAGNREAGDLRNGLEALKADIAKRQIPAAELRGATITLSNFGVLGAGRFASLVVVPPQVAIIGAGRMAERLVMSDDGPVARLMLPLSLTFDHRVVNGGEAARFLKALMDSLSP